MKTYIVTFKGYLQRITQVSKISTICTLETSVRAVATISSSFTSTRSLLLQISTQYSLILHSRVPALTRRFVRLQQPLHHWHRNCRAWSCKTYLQNFAVESISSPTLDPAAPRCRGLSSTAGATLLQRKWGTCFGWDGWIISWLKTGNCRSFAPNKSEEHAATFPKQNRQCWL